MRKLIKPLFLVSLFAVFFEISCQSPGSKTTGEDTSKDSQKSNISAKVPDTNNFKSKVDGKETSLYILKNKNGMEAGITNYGGRIVSLLVPDKRDSLVDVVLGYDDVKTYQKPKESHFGALIGRYGNRIAKGKFTLSGKAYQLDVNDGVNTLHGGFKGFGFQVWDGKQLSDSTLELTYHSKDGEGGYPGNLTAKVTYTLQGDNSIKIAYSATTDKATVVNLTNHAYFNLNGAGDQSILNDLLSINADKFTPVDTTLIPTGELKPVKGTPFDFTTLKSIGRNINDQDDQLKNGKGYDHNFVLNKHTLSDKVATVKSPTTGIVMDVYTEEPGLQFYSGNFLTGKDADGKGGATYGYRSALCLETQHFPDSPNQPSFPSTVLQPGQTYHTSTIYKFSVEK
ncbi:aldose epimerase family protein [Mucilaginibacter agri]|uniref:Aldose 1-epimerase n=1 Tax=Mucilaginibacter agri TaxID=2695265 RepID=A0A965ZCD8_9SPHI|nr:aldose epimerase family protein [Mucilaginibacter agri]NCD68135.1 galactose-1-epimerase [Mucilaginibacter agri]